MKKVDKLVLSKFFGPFILTFLITLFIIVMQFLWKYIDDLVGKGLEWYIIAELIFYASASFVPLALPLAVLLSSIMTFGSLGENYELVALKSSGISLFRFMGSLIVAVVFISAGAFFFSNNILPVANLKFGTLLYDIRHQKPALNIKPGIFYNGIEGFNIKVGGKDSDNKTIHDIIVYDHTSGRGNDNVLIAEKGEMYSSEDDRYLILKLYNGKQYNEVKPESGKYEYEHMRTYFEEWEKYFDLSEFSLQRTDENFWKNHYQMLNLKQLQNSIDTLKKEMEARNENMRKNVNQYFSFLRYDRDSLLPDSFLKDSPDQFAESKPEDLPLADRIIVIKRATSLARNVKSFVGIASRDNKYRTKNIIKHELAWHRKFTLSVACIVLFFVGAPLGAIIRIGGLGMPMLMSILFFVIFHVFTMSGQEIAEESAISPFLGMWMATIVLTPVGIFLTYKAMNDSSLLSIEWYYSFMKKIFRRN